MIENKPAKKFAIRTEVIKPLRINASTDQNMTRFSKYLTPDFKWPKVMY